MDFEIKRWAAGKEGNLRALLATLQYVRQFPLYMLEVSMLPIGHIASISSFLFWLFLNFTLFIIVPAFLVRMHLYIRILILHSHWSCMLEFASCQNMFLSWSIAEFEQFYSGILISEG